MSISNAETISAIKHAQYLTKLFKCHIEKGKEHLFHRYEWNTITTDILILSIADKKANIIWKLLAKT